MNRSFLLSEPLAAYIDANWTREPDVLRDLRAETAPMPESGMQIGADQGQLFTVLLKAIGARRTLEIGVFTGYSSTVTALALPADGRIVACDVSLEYTATARRYWERAGVAHKIDLRIGPAVQTLDAMISAGEEPFDFAFIDADKGGYWDYFERAIRLMRPGGLIAFDNVLWSGRVADESDQEESTRALREFNQRLHKDPRVIVALALNGDGVTLAVKAS